MRWEPHFAWTPDRVADLRAYFDEGLTASEIMRRMGVGSRSAVIGKLHRMGLKRGAECMSARVKRGIASAPQATRRTPFQRKRVEQVAAFKPVPAPAAEPPGGHECGLLELRNVSCRWPVTDAPPHLFCGDPTADLSDNRPYCPYHTERAHNRGRDFEVAA